jgi:C4-type Zn-finger protein
MEKCPKCGSGNIIMIEYYNGTPYRYDGISEFNCRNCGYRQGRWTGNELKDGELEPPFGDMKYVTKELREYNL